MLTFLDKNQFVYLMAGTDDIAWHPTFNNVNANILYLDKDKLVYLMAGTDDLAWCPTFYNVNANVFR